MQKPSRNYGVDLLRILSIFGVVMLHVLLHGGVIDSADNHLQYSILWIFRALALPAVNCFMLISGFVGYRQERYYPKLKNLLSTTFTTVFYSVGICLLLLLLNPGTIGLRSLLNACVPFTDYWFFAAYLGVFLLAPVLHFFVHKGHSKMHFIFLLVVTLACCISLFVDAFSLKRGYSALWFVFLYTGGAMAKKYDLPGKFSKKVWLLVVLIAFLITWLPILILPLAKVSLLTKVSTMFASYISPTIVLMALGWLCIFAKTPCKPTAASAIAFLTPSVFSVYLIHDNIHIRTTLISQLHTLCDGSSTAVLILFIFGCAIGIFLCCLLIDLCKRLLFRVVKIDILANKLADWIQSAIEWLYHKLPFEAKQ